MRNHLGQIPVLGLLKAIVARHWAVCSSTTAAAMGSFLSIFVAALYVFNPVAESSDMTIQQIDQFNLSWTNSVDNDSGAGITFGLIEKFNLSFPRFTYDELAFPTVGLSSQNDATQDILQVHLPATRATLNCTVVPPQEITISTSNLESGGQATVTVEARLPVNCRFGGHGGNDSCVTFNKNFQMSSANATQKQSYGGMVLDLHVAPSFGDSTNFHSYGDGAGSRETDNPPGCPSLGFIFGYFAPGGHTNINVTAFTCSRLAEEVQTETPFLLPSLDLDHNHPPIPDESTVKYLANQTDALAYRIQVAFDTEVAANNGTRAFVPGNLTMLDPFFQALLYGQNSVDPKTLIGPGNAGRLVNTTNHVYRRYMAQAFNCNMRRNLSHPDQTTVSAALIRSNRTRLAQDETSKIVLQVLLAIMFICGLAAYLLENTKRVLPHSPTSIAGVASLLVGSELVDRSVVPKGSEWMSDKELEKKGIFQEETFGLGWWEGGEEGKRGRRFEIGIGKAGSRI